MSISAADHLAPDGASVGAMDTLAISVDVASRDGTGCTERVDVSSCRVYSRSPEDEDRQCKVMLAGSLRLPEMAICLGPLPLGCEIACLNVTWSSSPTCTLQILSAPYTPKINSPRSLRLKSGMSHTKSGIYKLSSCSTVWCGCDTPPSGASNLMRGPETLNLAPPLVVEMILPSPEL